MKIDWFDSEKYFFHWFNQWKFDRFRFREYRRFFLKISYPVCISLYVCPFLRVLFLLDLKLSRFQGFRYNKFLLFQWSVHILFYFKIIKGKWINFSLKFVWAMVKILATGDAHFNPAKYSIQSMLAAHTCILIRGTYMHMWLCTYNKLWSRRQNMLANSG